jgi:hypothetical protein
MNTSISTSPNSRATGSDRPGEQEDRLDVEDDEQHGHHRELHREAAGSWEADGFDAGLVGRYLARTGRRGTKQRRHDEGDHGEARRHDGQDEDGTYPVVISSPP